MIEKFKILRQKLFDGDEQNALNRVFETGNRKISWTGLYSHPLKNLKNETGAETFEAIIRESGFHLQETVVEQYRSQEGLEISYLKDRETIYLFSQGEYQPGRYLLYLESVWHLQRGMDKERLSAEIRSGKTVRYIYYNHESSGNTGLVEIGFHDGSIVLTWKECPPGSQYDESSYSLDEVHHFAGFAELYAFLEDHRLAYDHFRSL
jgi:hypothetical protein